MCRFINYVNALFYILQSLLAIIEIGTACPTGWYGDECQNKCSEHCGHSKDLKSKPCYVTTGNCQNNCQIGWTGLRCTSQCPANCLNGCHQSYAMCSDCPIGWSGNACNIACPPKCMNGCHQTQRTCLNKPISTHRAQITTVTSTTIITTFLVKRCGHNTYGPNCSQICGHCKDGQPCDTVTGVCMTGCSPGWHSDTCNQRIPTNGGDNFIGPIVGAVVSGSIIIAISIIVSVMLWRRRYRSLQNAYDAQMYTVYIQQHHESNTLANAYDQAIYFDVVENPYECLDAAESPHAE